MQQHQHVVVQGSNLRSQAENVIGTLESELKQELLASRMTREQDADVVRRLSLRTEATEESQQNLIAQMRAAAEQQFAFQAEEHRIEVESMTRRLQLRCWKIKQGCHTRSRWVKIEPIRPKPNKAWPIDRKTL